MENMIIFKLFKRVCVKSYRIIFLFLSFSASISASIEKNITIIPLPQNIKLENGFLKINSNELALNIPERYITSIINTDKNELGEEGYFLDINSKGIFLTAKTETGLFYARKTLEQLKTPEGFPFVKITDNPRYPYRGLLLDVSRHFFTKEEIMRFIDIMSFYKFNHFHWHLTDDGGWRIETESYPLLTQQASHRTDRIWKEWWKNGATFVSAGEKSGFGGYYSKADIKEVIEYASQRHVTVIPEIEFPGHSREVFAAYPELCCLNKPYESNVFCAGNEETYIFMEKVLNEIMDLFPSEIIHIGGDETSTHHWQNCPKCQSLMKKEGMKEAHDLHNYVIKKAEKIISSKGKRLAGWDEIASEKLSKSSIITSWRGDQAGINAIEKGYDVVFASLHHLYLDYFQANPNTQPFAHDGYTTIEKVYNYNPIPDSLSSNSKKHILGFQGQLWSEWIYDFKDLEYMAFPRALAIAELTWSKEDQRNWPDFRTRVTAHINRLKNAGINTYTLSSDLDSQITVDTSRQEIRIELKSEEAQSEIRYTTNGTMPDKNSRLYVDPIIVKDSIRLKAISFENDAAVGNLLTQNHYFHKAIGKNVTSNLNDNALEILTDGYTGGKTYLDGTWFNFSNNREFTIDLNKTMPIRSVSSRWMQLRAGANRYLPETVELLFSEDGINFYSGGVIHKENLPDNPILQYQDFTLNGNWNARYICLKVTSGGRGMSLGEIIAL